ncbi:hypothetical protein GCM10023093_28240 [Nemorincola caseinilytica]|uniref:Uncharacterized protein n=1 Tax=Nemorincola caseinilytica TaxID=2054315 RepID=A0ABP8NPH1_9BACT
MKRSIGIKSNEFGNSPVKGQKKNFHPINTKEIHIPFSTSKMEVLREETPEEVKKRIERSMKNMEKGNSVSFSGEEFQQLSKVLSGA